MWLRAHSDDGDDDDDDDGVVVFLQHCRQCLCHHPCSQRFCEVRCSHSNIAALLKLMFICYENHLYLKKEMTAQHYLRPRVWTFHALGFNLNESCVVFSDRVDINIMSINRKVQSEEFFSSLRKIKNWLWNNINKAGSIIAEPKEVLLIC